MRGDPMLTTKGTYRCGLDTLRLAARCRVESGVDANGRTTRGIEAACQALLPAFRYADGKLYAGLLLWHAGKSLSGGLAIETGADSLRHLSEQQLQQGDLAFLIASCHASCVAWAVARADWANQYGVLSSTDVYNVRQHSAAQALANGFVLDRTIESHSDPAGRPSVTQYYKRSLSTRERLLDGRCIVRTDEYLIRVYDAYDLEGSRYVRVEVQERIAARRLLGYVQPTPLTAAVLGSPYRAAEVQRIEALPKAAQFKAAVTALARNAPAEFLVLVEEFVNEVSISGVADVSKPMAALISRREAAAQALRSSVGRKPGVTSIPGGKK